MGAQGFGAMSRTWLWRSPLGHAVPVGITVALLTWLTYHAVAPGDQATPKTALHALAQALEAGDIDGIRRLTTRSGYVSLVRPPDYDGLRLRVIGARMRELEDRATGRAWQTCGPDCASFGWRVSQGRGGWHEISFAFVRVSGRWQLDHFLEAWS
jgi:hypothetical protein